MGSICRHFAKSITTLIVTQPHRFEQYQRKKYYLRLITLTKNITKQINYNQNKIPTTLLPFVKQNKKERLKGSDDLRGLEETRILVISVL